MEIYIDNIGKLKNARIELNGITVIAGENNTGKSTIGRTLYSIYNGLYDIDNKCAIQKYKYITDKVEKFLEINSFKFTKKQSLFFEITDELKDVFEVKDVNDPLLVEKLKEYFLDNYEDINSIEIDFFLNSLSKIINDKPTRFRSFILRSELWREFHEQYINVNHNKAKIILNENNQKYIFALFGDSVASFGKFISKTVPLYLDTPFAVDDKFFKLAFRRIENHHKTLEARFKHADSLNFYEQYTLDSEYKKIKNKLLKVTKGSFRETDSNIYFQENGFNKPINFRNLSAGLKSLTIIQRLMDNYALKENGMIIMDEPEIHLHPKWQLVLAELIVLLHKELNMTVLLTTHSPYFLNAIEVYSAKHGLADKTKYYLTYLVNDKISAYVDDVTTDLERVYELLAEPIRELDQMTVHIEKKYGDK